MTTTTYLEWEDQATGANNNTWGDVADANFTIFEQAIARYTSISTTGGTTTLTTSQNRYPIIKLTGILVSNATIVVRTAEKNWNFINATTGNFSVTVKTLAGTGKTIPRGRAVMVYCDGTNVERIRVPEMTAAQAGGTVDAITATFEPATVSGELQDGTMFIVEAAGANTSTTPTFNPDSTGALTITKNGGQALVAGDIRAAGHKLLLCYDASSTRYELINPYISLGAASDTAAGIVELATTTETLTGTDTARAVTPDAMAALWEQGSDVASATTTSLGEGGYFNITGTTTITDIDFATDKAGRTAWVKFAGALTLTHNATTLILPGGASITTAAGDTACFVSEGSDVVRCTSYNKASGLPVVSPSTSSYTLLSNAGTGSSATYVVSGLTLTSYKKLYIYFSGISATAGSSFFFTIAGVSSGSLSTAASTVSGYAEIDLATGFGYANDNPANLRVGNFGITTASTSITFGFTSGGSFDAGTIQIYGVA